MKLFKSGNTGHDHFYKHIIKICLQRCSSKPSILHFYLFSRPKFFDLQKLSSVKQSYHWHPAAVLGKLFTWPYTPCVEL